MAQSGTITQSRSNYREAVVTITAVLQGSTSPVFRSLGYTNITYTAQGVFDTSSAPTVTVQGSDDGGTTWFTLGTSFTAATAGAISPPLQLLRFNVSGGDSGTSINFYVVMSATFG